MLPQLKYLDFLSIVDILIVAYVFYKCITMIQGTRAVQLLKGLLFLVLATVVSKWVGLIMVNWILEKLMTVGLIAIPVVFQPELRRGLEHIGRGKLFAQPSFFMEEQESKRLIDELITAILTFSRSKIGALIIIERETGLHEVIATGIDIGASVSSELLVNIFIPNTPLHDGAVIIQGNRITAANCILPLTDNEWVSRELGTRHRSALGITEVSDALALIVSEETGVISLASGGKISRYLDEKILREKLSEIYIHENKWSVIKNWRPRKDECQK